MTGTAPDQLVRIFVYGTLRAGEGAAGLLQGCRRLGVVEVRGALYDVGGRFPALVLGGEGEVEGEIWECPEPRLRILDEYEGVGQGLFRREVVRMDDGDCWTYVAGSSLLPLLEPERVIRTGRWPAGR